MDSMSQEKTIVGTGSRVVSYSADRVGIWASGLCIAHCVLTPILLSFSAVFAHLLPSEEKIHRSLAVGIAVIGGIALLYGYRRHRRSRILLLMGSGLGLIFAGAWWGDRLPSHWVEVSVTTLGSILMIFSHRLNHTFCRHCTCAAASRDLHD